MFLSGIFSYPHYKVGAWTVPPRDLRSTWAATRTLLIGSWGCGELGGDHERALLTKITPLVISLPRLRLLGSQGWARVITRGVYGIGRGSGGASMVVILKNALLGVIPLENLTPGRRKSLPGIKKIENWLPFECNSIWYPENNKNNWEFFRNLQNFFKIYKFLKIFFCVA